MLTQNKILHNTLSIFLYTDCYYAFDDSHSNYLSYIGYFIATQIAAMMLPLITYLSHYFDIIIVS